MIVDEYSRVWLAIDVERRLPSDDVGYQLPELFVQRGVPQHIRSDHGPEFAAKAMQHWLARVGGADRVSHAGQSVGERLYREFQREVT